MIDHVSVRANDYEKSKAFYIKALSPLGYSMLSEFAEYKVAGFGEPGRPDFWLNGKGEDHEQHVALMAKDKNAVDAFYKAGLAAGGTDNGAPGYRKDYSPGYYAAFLKDPDGHNIEVVFHDPNPSA